MTDPAEAAGRRRQEATLNSDLVRRARDWQAQDPDPETRAELGDRKSVV